MHEVASLRRMFDELVNRLENVEKVAVLPSGRICQEEASMRGHFTPSSSPDDEWSGRIRIFRTRATEPEDPLEELAVLAHEAGHYETFRDSLRPSEYQAAVDKVNAGEDTSANERLMVWEEEVRAWEHAAAILTGLGFEDWDGFRRCARDGLQGYEETLDMPGAVAGVALLRD